MNLWSFIKGILIHETNDKSKELSLEVSPSATTDKRMTVISAHTDDRTLNLPDITDTLVSKNTTDILTNKEMDFSSGGTNTLTADAVDVLFDNTASGLVATEVQGALNEVEARVDTVELDLQNHINDAIDAHDASAISSIPFGALTATDVQGALNELDADLTTVDTNLNNHITDITDAHDASAISNVPSGNLIATDVQSALDELQTDIDGRQPSGNYITELTGDVTALGPGSVAATIANSSVTNSKMANMPAHTFKGNNTALSAVPLDLTKAELTAELNVFTDLLQGVVPASGGGTTNFLRADGTWAAMITGANTALSNLTTTSINQNLLPSSNDTFDIGASTSRWNAIQADRLNVYENNTTINGVIFSFSNSFKISTPNTVLSNNIMLTTGNSSGGNSGNIELYTGLATGTQGVFKFLKSGVPSVSGYVWTASAVDGTGYWAPPSAAVALLAVASKSANYTTTTFDDVILGNASSGSFVITLVTAVGNTGKVFYIKKIDSSINTVTIDANSTETIDGSLTKIISNQYDTISIVSNGSNWSIL